MLKKSFRNRSVKSISALLSASTLVMGMGLSLPVQASEPFLAEIRMFAGNFAPRSWAFCDGQILPISQNTALFSLMGTTFGGDGRTTFGLPDLRGRVAVHPGTGPGLSNVRYGERGGAENVTLSVANLPSHNHTATGAVLATDTSGNSADPTGNILAIKSRTNIYSDAAPNVNMKANSVAVTVGNAGGNQSFSVRNPFLGIYHIIATQGLYPSRS